jgi:hypothetical protein
MPWCRLTSCSPLSFVFWMWNSESHATRGPRFGHVCYTGREYYTTLKPINFLYRALKNLWALRWYSTHLHEQESPSQHVSRNQRLLRYGRYSCDLCSRCSVWCPCISTQLSALRRTEVRTLLKIPGFTRIFWQAFSTRCRNTSKSLIGAEHTKVFRCPQSQKSRWLGSGDRADLRVLSTVHRKSGSGAVWQCGENEAVPHHAWTTCVVVDEEAHVEARC